MACRLLASLCWPAGFLLYDPAPQATRQGWPYYRRERGGMSSAGLPDSSYAQMAATTEACRLNVQTEASSRITVQARMTRASSRALLTTVLLTRAL